MEVMATRCCRPSYRWPTPPRQYRTGTDRPRPACRGGLLAGSCVQVPKTAKGVRHPHRCQCRCHRCAAAGGDPAAPGHAGAGSTDRGHRMPVRVPPTVDPAVFHPAPGGCARTGRPDHAIAPRRRGVRGCRSTSGACLLLRTDGRRCVPRRFPGASGAVLPPCAGRRCTCHHPAARQAIRGPRKASA